MSTAAVGAPSSFFSAKFTIAVMKGSDIMTIVLALLSLIGTLVKCAAVVGVIAIIAIAALLL